MTAICNVCGEEKENVMLRTTEHYDDIKAFHKIQKKPDDFHKEILTLNCCWDCAKKYKGSKIIGCKTPLMVG